MGYAEDLIYEGDGIWKLSPFPFPSSFPFFTGRKSTCKSEKRFPLLISVALHTVSRISFVAWLPTYYWVGKHSQVWDVIQDNENHLPWEIKGNIRNNKKSEYPLNK